MIDNGIYIRTNAKKLKMIIHMGGKCEDCGLALEEKLPIADFHHLDPNLKEFNPSDTLTMVWDKCKVELDKCMLLCTNCHRIRHYDWERFNENREKIREYVDVVEERQMRIVHDDPEIIQQVLLLHSQGEFLRTIAQKLGIVRCSVKRILKLNNLTLNKWVARDELGKISKDDFQVCADNGMSAGEISKKYDCCKATVFNLAKHYNIKLKTRIKRSDANIAKSRQMLADGSTKEQVCQHFAISGATLNRWLGSQ